LVIDAELNVRTRSGAPTPVTLADVLDDGWNGPSRCSGTTRARPLSDYPAPVLINGLGFYNEYQAEYRCSSSDYSASEFKYTAFLCEIPTP
jgi:hypothetical protein